VGLDRHLRRGSTFPPMFGELKDYLPFATSLCGAFFGALGAYWVGRFKEKRDEDKRQHSALLATQYSLHSQWSILDNIRKCLLEPVRNDPQRHMKQKQFLHTLGNLPVPFQELAFILDTETPNLLQDIHIAERRFLISLEYLERLNKLRIELTTKYAPEHFHMHSGTGRVKVPEHEVYALKEFADLLYKEVDKALPELKNTNELIYAFLKRHLKGRKGIKFAPIEQPVSNATTSP